MTSYVCRFCCYQKKYDNQPDKSDFLPIFTSTNKQTKETIAHMAMACTKTRIQQNDGLPETCCWKCLIKLQVAYEFTTLVSQSHKMLRQWSKQKLLKWSQVPKVENLCFDLPGIALNVDDPIHGDNLVTLEVKLEEDNKPKNKSVMKRVMSHKKNAGPFVCSYCQKIHRTYSKHVAHERVHTGERPFACQICDGEYKVKSALTSHYKQVHHMVPPRYVTHTNEYKCQICDSLFLNKKTLMAHVNWHGNGRFKCDECTLLFDHRDQFRSHLISHGRSESECDGIIEEQQPTAIQHQCQHCEELFESRTSLLLHMSAHTNNNQFPCPDCSQIFNQKRSLMSHVQNKHMHTTEPDQFQILRFTCVICLKKCTTKFTLMDHFRSHTGQQPYGCTECPSRFPVKSGLRRHFQDVHMKTRDEIDEVFALKTFVNEDELTLNDELTMNFLKMLDKELQASDEKDEDNHEDNLLTIVFPCILCQNVFEERSMLCEHLETHLTTKAGAYSCKLCLETFHLMINLRQHVQTHANTEMDESLQDALNANVKIDHAFSDSFQKSLQTHGEGGKSKLPHPTMCFVCCESFKKYETHVIKIHLPQREFQCRLCDFKTANDPYASEMRNRPIISYGMHFFTSHTTLSAYPPTCFVCFKTFKSNVMVMVHLRLHYSAKCAPRGLKTCSTCCKVYKDNERFREHEASHLPEELRPNKDYLCPHCGKGFKNRVGIELHLRYKHTNGSSLDESQLTKEDISKIFKQLKELNQLDKNEPLNAALKGCSVCPFCSVTHDSPSRLGKHLRLHFKERPFKCGYCSKAFRLKTHLLSHTYVHSDSQYQCSQCHTLFKRMASLKKHQRDIHGGKKKRKFVRKPNKSVSVHND